MANIKPTLKEPMSPQSEKFEKDFKKTMIRTGAPAIRETQDSLNEVDGMLNEVEKSLKKKIFSLAKMESLVFSDPKLSVIYDEMAENGEEKYGYHYNETIQNMIFNDYVLNSPKYLQKYKMAIPKEKKRRDKSGINQLKKAGEKKMTQSGLPKPQQTDVSEGNEAPTKVAFLINEKDPENADLFAYFPEEDYNQQYKSGYSHVGQHSGVHPQYAAESRPATPEEYQDLKVELEGIGYNLEVLNGMQESTSAGGAGGAAGYVGYAGPAAFSTKGDLSGDFKGKKKLRDPKAKPISKVISITESNYLTDPSEFEKYVQTLNEESDTAFIERNGSNTYGNVDNMNPENQKIIKTDIQTGKMDNNNNIKDGIALQEDNIGKLTTVEQVKALGRKLTNADVPNLAGEALYRLAIQLANRMLSIGWDDLGDVNSMWDYIDQNGGMTYEQLVEVVKEACNDRLAEEGMSLDDLNEKAKSKSQQRFMGMVHAVQKGKVSPDEVGDSVAKAANSMSNKDAEDFASTKHKDLPEKIDEFLSLHDTVEYLSDRSGENVFEMGGDRWQFVNAKYPDGKTDIGVYRFGHNLVYDYKRWMEEFNINENNIKEDMQTMIDNNGTSMSNKAQATGDMSSEVPMGAQQTGGLNENEEFIPHGSYTVSNSGGYEIMLNDAGDAARVRDAFGSDNPQTSDWLEIEYIPSEDGESEPVIDPNGYNIPLNQVMKIQQTNELNESDIKLLEEINKELEAFSIHHDKLKLMSENKKTPSMIQGDRLRSENPKNFKKDLQHSGTKEIIDVEKELQWKDQQTDVGTDPQKLGQDIEKAEIKTADMEGDEALKNVGDSANDSGDEIPKRNLTSDEQKEVNLYRKGLHSPVFDNEPGERFEDRMKADMGEEIYDQREKQLEFNGKAPMYNKDPQPVEDTTAKKVQFDKEQTGWNEKMGIGNEKSLKESMVTGRYIDALGKRRLIEFRLNEVTLNEDVEDLFVLDFTGLGNTYNSKTVNKKVVVNETVVSAMASHNFYTNGKEVVGVKNPVQPLNEDEVKVNKPVLNEQMDKMKHLLNYKPDSFVSTKNVKKNRGF